ncbi:MAG TPA: hypothetical protein ENH55_18665 [Aurantimonas coralicida]|nr:hypothetical protein [Aurantimonas coralicida]
MVAGFHDPDLLNAVLNSDHLHNTFLPLPRAYSESRNELSKALTIQGYDQTEAVVDLGRMTMNQQVSVIELNQLLEEMFVISLKDLHDLDFALRALVIQLKRHCRVAISLDFPEQLIARHRTQSDTTQETPSRYRTG